MKTKLDEELIKQLREGKITLYYDKSNLEVLNTIMKAAFPSTDNLLGTASYYYKINNNILQWDCSNMTFNKMKEIVPIKDFIMDNTLKVGDKVELMGDTYIVYRPYYSETCWLRIEYKVNSTIFRKLGINNDKYNFQEKTLGYTLYIGDFPECKSLEDLTKFVNTIKDKMENNKKIIGYNLKDEKYRDAANSLLQTIKGLAGLNYKESSLPSIQLEENIGVFRREGLLEMWFEPVYEEKLKLPKIGCQEGEVTQGFIKYGNIKMHKSQLRAMEDAGIVYLTVMDSSGKRHSVYETRLETIYEIARQ